MPRPAGAPAVLAGAREWPPSQPRLAPYGHGCGSQGLAGGPRVHPELPRAAPAAPASGAAEAAPRQSEGAESSEWAPAQARAPAGGAAAKAAQVADVEAPPPGAGAPRALPPGMLGHRFRRRISVNWCGPPRAAAPGRPPWPRCAASCAPNTETVFGCKAGGPSGSDCCVHAALITLL